MCLLKLIKIVYLIDANDHRIDSIQKVIFFSQIVYLQIKDTEVELESYKITKLYIKRLQIKKENLKKY